MDIPSVAPDEAQSKPEHDFYRIHPVVIALSKARAARALLELAAGDSGNTLDLPGGAGADESWIPAIAAEALYQAIGEAEATLRASLTPEQVRAPIIGEPAGVA